MGLGFGLFLDFRVEVPEGFFMGSIRSLYGAMGFFWICSLRVVFFLLSGFRV